VKLAIVGLATTDPYDFGEVLKSRDIEIACVWDYEHSKADEYHRRFGGEILDDIELVADAGVDGAIVSVRQGDHARYALPFIEGGVPALICNPIGLTQQEIDRIIEAVEEHRTPIMFAREIGDFAEVTQAFLEFCDIGEAITHPDETVEVVYPVALRS